MTTDQASADALPSLVKRGIGWMIASQGVLQALALVTTFVIARSMSPRDVGLASEASVFVNLALIMVDFGVGSLIVQRPALTEEQISTLFWIGMAIGVVLTAGAVVLSDPIAQLYGEPQVRDLFVVLSLTFLVTAPGIVPGALLTRELQFRRLETRTIIATVVSATIAIVMAVSGFGPWAIVAQGLAMATVSTVLLWRATSWRPSKVFVASSVRSFAGFTSNVLGARMLSWGNANLDNLIVGRFLGADALGVYSLAFAVALILVTRIATPITQVFFPAFSKIRDREQIADVWLRAIRVLAFVVVPAMLGLMVVGPDLVQALFGARWHQAGSVIQILAGVGLLQSLAALNDGVLQALAHTRTLFRFGLLISAATVIAFLVGVNTGIDGVAYCYLAVTAVLQPLYVRRTAILAGTSIRAWIKAVLGVCEAGCVMLVVIAFVQRLLVSAHVAPGLRLAGIILLACVVYFPAAAWRAPEVPREFRALVDRRRGRARSAGP